MAIRVKVVFADSTPEVVTSVVDTPRVGDTLTFPNGSRFQVSSVDWNLSLQPMRTFDVELTVEAVDGS